MLSSLISRRDSYLGSFFDFDDLLVNASVVRQTGFIENNAIFVVVEPDGIRVTPGAPFVYIPRSIIS